MEKHARINDLIAKHVFDYIVLDGFIIEARVANRYEKITPGIPVPPYCSDIEKAKDVVCAMLTRHEDKLHSFFQGVPGFLATKPLVSYDVETWTENLDPMGVCLAALKALKVSIP